MLSLIAGCSEDVNDESREHVHVPEYHILPDNLENASNPVYHNNKLYFTSAIEDTGLNIWSLDRIYTMNLDGTDFYEISGYSPEISDPDSFGEVYISDMRIDDNGSIWIVEQSNFYRYDLPSDFDDDESDISEYYEDLGRSVKLMKLSNTGAKEQIIELSSISGLSGNVNSFEIDNNGNIFLHDDSQIYVLDSSGTIQFDLSANDFIITLLRMQDGSVSCVVSGHTMTSMSLRNIDLRAQAWGNTIELTSSYAQNAYPGGEGFDLLIDDNISLSGVNLSSGESEKFFDWSSVGVEGGNERYVRLLSDGQILCVETKRSNNPWRGTLNIVILQKTPISDVPELTTLTIAGFGLTQDMQNAIAEFNRYSSKYHVEFIDYTNFSSDGHWLQGLERLSTEIIAGQVPDILETRLLTLDKYVEKGILVDLYDFIDSDPEYGRDSFVKGALNALELSGGLYQIISEFYISTIIGHPAVLGLEPGWTVDEFITVITKNPDADFPLGIEFTKESFMQTALRFNLDEYIDRSAGTVHFDSDNFVKLLEFANTFPSDFTTEELSRPELVASERQLMVVLDRLADFDYLQIYRAVFGGDLVFKGFPADNKLGHRLSYDSGLAITTSCTDKEGAWEFIRTILKNNQQTDSFVFALGFPIIKEEFDLLRISAMTERNSTFNYDGFIIDLKPVTKDDNDQFMALIDSLSGTSIFDLSLQNIVLEAASDFFEGRSSAQDATRIIQSRASIYIAEQNL
jgi:ABC-type glycerol-3-phosphate transport system substrate-binding protein